MNTNAFTRAALSAERIEALPLENSFWKYSLKLWQNKTLQDTLLQLQDAQEFRINLLLFAMWAGMENIDIKPHLQTIDACARNWYEEVVAPLRQVRKSLAKHALRAKIQESELQAEQIEQALLFELSQKFPANEEDTSLNILIRNLFASRLPKSHLLLCIQACLPKYSEADILTHINELKD